MVKKGMTVAVTNRMVMMVWWRFWWWGVFGPGYCFGVL